MNTLVKKIIPVLVCILLMVCGAIFAAGTNSGYLSAESNIKPWKDYPTIGEGWNDEPRVEKQWFSGKFLNTDVFSAYYLQLKPLLIIRNISMCIINSLLKQKILEQKIDLKNIYHKIKHL